MRNVFISFLGTNDYLPCNYMFKGFDPVQNVRFVQEACIARWCEQWSADDRIFICVTEESCVKNWLDSGHKDREGNAQIQQGLKTRLETLQLAAPIEKVMIPAGRSEEEIWAIFEQVFGLLDEGDNLALDITHAFRSLPMLAMVILSYAKVMRRISVRAISYGAMEVLGKIEDVRKMPVEKRDVPVFDLLPFDRLQDWMIAVERFTATGDAALVERLADMDMRPIIKATKGQNTDAVTIKKLGQHLKTFSAVLATCRGRNISACAASVKQSLQGIEDMSTLKPLQPLLHKIEPIFASFCGEEIADGLAAARWCLDHQLYQQGYTILQETMITFIINRALGTNGRDRDERTLVNQVVSIVQENRPETDWRPESLKHKEKTYRMIEWIHSQSDLWKSMSNLTAIRNDLNHAGQNDNPRNPDTLCGQLAQYVAELEGVFARNNLSSNSLKKEKKA